MKRLSEEAVRFCCSLIVPPYVTLRIPPIRARVSTSAICGAPVCVCQRTTPLGAACHSRGRAAAWRILWCWTTQIYVVHHIKLCVRGRGAGFWPCPSAATPLPPCWGIETPGGNLARDLFAPERAHPESLAGRGLGDHLRQGRRGVFTSPKVVHAPRADLS